MHFFGKVLRILTVGGIVVLLIFTPLAFGTVEDWAFSLMTGVSLIVFALWLMRKMFFIPSAVIHKNYARQKEKKAYFSDKPLHLRSKFLRFLVRTFTPGKHPHTQPEEKKHFNSFFIFGRRFVNTGLEIPLLIILLLIGIQITPLPTGFVKYIAPGSYSYYADYLPGYEKGKVDFSGYTSGLKEDVRKTQNTEFKTGFSSWRTVSLYPGRTFRSFIKYLVYLMIFFVCVNEFQEKIAKKACIYTVVGMGTFIALEGIFQHFYSNDYLLLLRPGPQGLSTGVSFGPFVNRNHFGGYLILIFPLTVALLLSLIKTRQEGDDISKSTEGRDSKRKLFYTVKTSETEYYARLFLSCYVIAIIVAALVISGSKAGIALAGLSAVVLLYLSGEKKATGFLSLILGFCAIGYMIVDVMLNLGVWEYIKHSSIKTRQIAWKGTWKMFCDFPLFGSGIGTFEKLNRAYMDIGVPWHFREAHNDYLELLSTGGVLIAIPVILLILSFWMKAFYFVKNNPKDYFSTALIAGLFVLCIHEFVDFNLQIGSNAFLFTVLAGLFLAHIQDANTKDV